MRRGRFATCFRQRPLRHLDHSFFIATHVGVALVDSGLIPSIGCCDIKSLDRSSFDLMAPPLLWDTWPPHLDGVDPKK